MTARFSTMLQRLSWSSHHLSRAGTYATATSTTTPSRGPPSSAAAGPSARLSSALPSGAFNSATSATGTAQSALGGSLLSPTLSDGVLVASAGSAAAQAASPPPTGQSRSMLSDPSRASLSPSSAAAAQHQQLQGAGVVVGGGFNGRSPRSGPAVVVPAGAWSQYAPAGFRQQGPPGGAPWGDRAAGGGGGGGVGGWGSRGLTRLVVGRGGASSTARGWSGGGMQVRVRLPLLALVPATSRGRTS